MKRLDQIDNLFEDQLSGMKVAPPEGSWSQISGALDNAAAGKSKRRKIVAWFALSASVAAVLLYVLYFKSCDTGLNTSQQPQLAKQETPISNTTSEPTNVSISDKAGNSSYEEHMQITSQTKELEDPSSYKLNPSAPLATTNPNASSSTVAKNTAALSSQPYKESNSPIEPIQPEENAATSSSEVELAQSTQPDSQPKDKTIEQDNSGQTPNPVESSEQNVSIAKAPSTLEESNNLDSADTQLSAPNLSQGLRYATGFSVQAYGGFAYHTNNGGNNISNQGIYNKAADQNLSDFNIGIGARFHVNNFFIHSGLQLGSYGERTSFDWTKNLTEHLGMDSTGNTITQWNYIDTSIFVIQPGDTIITYEAIIDTQYTIYNVYSIDTSYDKKYSQTAKNRFRYIEVPFMVGYRQEFKKISIDISTGIGVAIPYAVSGYYIENDVLRPMQNNNIYENTAVNFLLRAGIHYHMKNNLAISFMPGYRTNLTRLQQQSYYNALEYQSFTLNVGVTRTF